MSESVELQYEFQSPVEKVWNALTTPELLSQWMMFKSNSFKPELGHAFQFSGADGYDGVIDCEVIELVAPRVLAYTWSTLGRDNQPHSTVVSFRLSESATGGTILNLVQSGFRPEAKQEIGGARYGWEHMMGQFANLLQ